MRDTNKYIVGSSHYRVYSF